MICFHVCLSFISFPSFDLQVRSFQHPSSLTCSTRRVWLADDTLNAPLTIMHGSFSIFLISFPTIATELCQTSPEKQGQTSNGPLYARLVRFFNDSLFYLASPWDRFLFTLSSSSGHFKALIIHTKFTRAYSLSVTFTFSLSPTV